MITKPILLIFTLFHLNQKINAQFDISKSANEFSINLLKTTNLNVDKLTNLAMSPFTVWTILANLNEGANGATSRQLENTLKIANVNRDLFRRQFQNLSKILTKTGQDVTLDITNAMFTKADQKLNEQFAATSRKTYGIEITPINFQDPEAAAKINNFIAKSTRHRIKKFIGSGDLLGAQIFIASILYFKGGWTMPFNRALTKTEPFYDENRNKIANVEMMHHTGFFPFTRVEELNCIAVEIPYGDGATMSMVALLPYEGETINNALEKMTKFSNILDLLEQAKYDFEGDDVQLSFPKFAFRYDINLNAILDMMGVKDLFNSQTAELRGMFFHYLYVSRLMQSAQIEVNEEGTVATAVAGATVANKSPPPRFLANRPFLYFIVNKPTKTIVFSGKISNPST